MWSLPTLSPPWEVTSSHLQFILHLTCSFGMEEGAVKDRSRSVFRPFDLLMLRYLIFLLLSPVLLLLIPSVIFLSTPFSLVGFVNAAEHSEAFPLLPDMEITGLRWWMACFCEIWAVTGSPETGREREKKKAVREGTCEREWNVGNMGGWTCRRGNKRKGIRPLSWVHSERNKDDEGGAGNMRERIGGREAGI